MMFLLLTFALVSWCSVKDTMLNYWLFDVYWGGVGEKRDEDNGEFVVGDSGSIGGLCC